MKDDTVKLICIPRIRSEERETTGKWFLRRVMPVFNRQIEPVLEVGKKQWKSWEGRGRPSQKKGACIQWLRE